jgi:hypothetical protein
VMDPDDAVRITRSLLFEKKWKAKKAVSFCYCHHFTCSVSLSTEPTFDYVLQNRLLD